MELGRNWSGDIIHNGEYTPKSISGIVTDFFLKRGIELDCGCSGVDTPVWLVTTTSVIVMRMTLIPGSFSHCTNQGGERELKRLNPQQTSNIKTVLWLVTVIAMV